MKIRKGDHYPFPFFMTPTLRWVSKKHPTHMEKSFRFTESCFYDLQDEDQWDVNKLFGFSIGWHHKTSFRFGWRPILNEHKIEIVGYEYHDGERLPTKRIYRIEPNRLYHFKLSYHPSEQKTEYEITNIKKFVSLFTKPYLKKTGGLGYNLGLYFGGNERAPQNIEIKRH